MCIARLEPVPVSASVIAQQPASYDIWDKKYRLKNKLGADRTPFAGELLGCVVIARNCLSIGEFVQRCGLSPYAAGVQWLQYDKSGLLK